MGLLTHQKTPHDNNSPTPITQGEEGASLPNRLLFLWMSPLFRRAKDHATRHERLENEDLLPLGSFDHGDRIHRLFHDRWSSTHSLPRALLSVVGSRFVIAGAIKVLNSFLQFSFPLILNAILRYIEESSSSSSSTDTTTDSTTTTTTTTWTLHRGYYLSALLMLVMVSKAITESAYFQRINRCALHTRVAVSVAVYRKALVLSHHERQSTTLGELVNLMQVDATKLEMFLPQAHVLWDGLLQIAGYMTILYTLIGWPCFAGLGLMVVTMPVQAMVVQKLFGLNRAMVGYTDERVRTTNEALQGMQVGVLCVVL